MNLRILDCNYCGNKTPHRERLSHKKAVIYDELEDGEKLYNDYTWLAYECGTCGSISMYGAFLGYDTLESQLDKAILYPAGASIQPPLHSVTPAKPIPQNILTLYEEVWPLRHRAPAAFVAQVRRLLEFICLDKNAEGKNLYSKLKELSNKGILPGYFVNISDLLRKVGNMGAHAGDTILSTWDAELIDDFFRSIVDYVYIAPAKIRRLEERLKEHEETS